MTRSALASGNRTEIAGAAVRTAILVDIAFPSGTVYATSAAQPIVYNNNRYAPGKFAGAAGPTESTGLKPKRISIKMSGADAALITKVMSDPYHFAEANIYLALLDENWKPVADPHPVGSALLMSAAVVTLDTGTGEVEISAETGDIFNARSSAALATPEAQKLRYPGDTGMDRVAETAQKEVEWAGRVSFVGFAMSAPSVNEYNTLEDKK